MHRLVYLIAALVCLAGCGPAAVPAADAFAKAYSEFQLDELRERLQSAESSARDSDLDQVQVREADVDLQSLMKDPRFERLDKSERADAWDARAWAAVNLEQKPQARERFLVAIRLDTRDAWHWLGLAQADDDLERFEESANALRRGLEANPTLIKRFDWLVIGLAKKTRPGSPATLRLLRFLRGQAWNSIDWQSDAPWRRLAREELRVGNRAAAAAALQRIASPTGVILVRIDKRFDGLYDPGSPAFDITKVAASRIAFLESRVKAEPRNLRTHVELNHQLLQTDQFERVLSLADATLKALDNGGEFTGMRYLAALKEQRSSALEHLGRKQEAEMGMQDAAATEEDGEPNVSQALNLAGRYCNDGDGKKAAGMLAKAGKDLNPYGRSVFHYLSHCAAVLEGNQAVAAKELIYLREHRDEGKSQYLRALLRENMQDEAALEAIRRLESEQLREDMLYLQQDFASSGDSKPDQLDRRWHIVFARPDVRAEFDRVGRVETFPYRY